MPCAQPMIISIFMTDATIFPPAESKQLIDRVLSMTDRAWQAHASGRAFEFREVEAPFMELLEAVQGMNSAFSDDVDPASAGILRALAAIGFIAKRKGALEAFKTLVKAAGPITNRSKCLDTAKR